MAASNDLQEALKPFHQRASEAEERLARLEAAAFSTTKVTDSGNEGLLERVAELQKMLEDAKAEKATEREKALKEAQKANEENAKLRYRISHLLRALEKADSVLASK